MRLGNDIVDRRATQGHNPRFVDRVLNPEERGRRAQWSLDEAPLWIYWACKEAAYKAIRQTEDIPFHHREFIVDADFTKVRYHETVLSLHTLRDGDAIFALATDGDPDACLSRIEAAAQEETPSVQSERARILLRELAMEYLRLPGPELAVITEQRIPKILHAGRILPYAASLTHHGRYVAASLAIP